MGIEILDLKIINARVRKGEKGALVAIGIKDGKITAIAPEMGQQARETLDASGGLVTESFINGHLHLCKVYTLEMAGQAALGEYHQGGMGGAMTAIERAADFKAAYDKSWILPNIRRACDLALHYGNTHIRAFADVDSKARLEGIKALLEARAEYSGRVELQVVAFPQDGVVRESEASGYVEEAMRLGADVVGGIPWIEFTQEDEKRHVDEMFSLAKKYGKDVSMLLDDVGDAGERTLEMCVLKAIEQGWQGRVTAQHCRAMALYEENYFRKIAALMRKANIGLVADPHTGPLHARVRDLAAAGVNVALGQDDIADAYYPYGRCNMQEIAFLASHLMWMTSFQDMELLYDMITTSAARVLGISGHVLEPGGNADLVVLKAEDVYHAIWEHEAPVYVIRKGVVVKR
jgi:cytosine deaminase